MARMASAAKISPFRPVSVFVLASFLACGCSQRPTIDGDLPIPTAGDEAETGGAAPDQFQVLFETTKGNFTIEVTRDWSPQGADRFHQLVKAGFYDGCAFFRVIRGFMAQTGINGNPQLQSRWRDATIPDDPVVRSNQRGYVSFAMGGPNSRSTQFFINSANNSRLDSMGFSPFGQVVEGMETVDSLYSGYGDGPPGGRGPNQGEIQHSGNQYLQQAFPNLDYIKSARLLESAEDEPESAGQTESSPAEAATEPESVNQ